jgi:hypothetical protein
MPLSLKTTAVMSHCHHRPAVTLEPANRDYLCRLAKQWSDLTYEEGATIEAIQEVNAKAIEYAERVIAMAPKVGCGVSRRVCQQLASELLQSVGRMG